jgi:hypothetical protein
MSWEGGAGYTEDGVDPDNGQPDDEYTFKVTVTDVDGDEPDPVNLILRKDGARWQTVAMQAGAGDITTGRVYSATMALPIGNYAYRFRAQDDDGSATGDPTIVRPGPIMPAYPIVLYSSGPGYDNVDGVEPNVGDANDTLFRFNCLYKSHDGDLPEWVGVRLWRDGAFYRQITLVQADPAASPVEGGILFRGQRRLDAGAYSYKFLGRDTNGENAHGPATALLSNLTVNGASSTVTALSAVPTAAGAQITFGLSSSAQVQARVLNIAGRPVRAICQAQNCEAGTNTLVWNAFSDEGLPVPNGVYLVEVATRADDGTESKALTQVRLQR